MEPANQQQDGNTVVLVVTTFSTLETARLVTRPLIERRLCACVQFFPTIRSLYWWNGELVESDEVAAWLKTTSALQAQCVDELRAAHPYTTPEMMVLRPEHIDQAYAQWVIEETASSP